MHAGIPNFFLKKVIFFHAGLHSKTVIIIFFISWISSSFLLFFFYLDLLFINNLGRGGGLHTDTAQQEEFVVLVWTMLLSNWTER